jgi:hypothetical protein
MTKVICDQKDCRFLGEDKICQAEEIDLEMWLAFNLSKSIGKRGLWCNRHDETADTKLAGIREKKV